MSKKDPQHICKWCKEESDSLDKHHHPIPKSSGGEEIVEICKKCHQLYHSRLVINIHPFLSEEEKKMSPKVPEKLNKSVHEQIAKKVFDSLKNTFPGIEKYEYGHGYPQLMLINSEV